MEFYIEHDICPNMLREEWKHSEISKIKLTKYSTLQAGKKNSSNESNIVNILSSFMITNRIPS